MTLIYSNKEVKGLIGAYIEPFRFNGTEKCATKVYTEDTKIVEAYKLIGVEVLPFNEDVVNIEQVVKKRARK